MSGRHLARAIPLALLVAVVVVGPWIYRSDPIRTNASALNSPPGSSGHPLGTDSLGRDLLARVLVGGRTSLLIAVLVGGLAVAIGIAIGVAAGVGPRLLDAALMRATDALMTVPFLVLVLGLRSVLAPGVGSVVLVLVAFTWLPVARVVRAQVLALRERTFITASIAAGCRTTTLVWRHLLPNALPPVRAIAAVVCAEAIVAETTLSWLRLGVPVDRPTWGNILVDAQREALLGNWWSLAVPGAAVALTIFAVTVLVGDRSVLGPAGGARF